MTTEQIAEMEYMRVTLRMILNGTKEAFEVYQQVAAQHLAEEVKLGRISNDLKDYLIKKDDKN
jgi:hypothetical protein